MPTNIQETIATARGYLPFTEGRERELVVASLMGTLYFRLKRALSEYPKSRHIPEIKRLLKEYKRRIRIPHMRGYDTNRVQTPVFLPEWEIEELTTSPYDILIEKCTAFIKTAANTKADTFDTKREILSRIIHFKEEFEGLSPNIPPERWANAEARELFARLDAIKLLLAPVEGSA